MDRSYSPPLQVLGNMPNELDKHMMIIDWEECEKKQAVDDSEDSG